MIAHIGISEREPVTKCHSCLVKLWCCRGGAEKVSSGTGTLLHSHSSVKRISLNEGSARSTTDFTIAVQRKAVE